MQSRRIFIKKAGCLAAQSTILFSSKCLVSPFSSIGDNKLKHIRIGIIGAENNRTLSFANTFNIRKAFPEVEVTHVWGETEAFANRAKEMGKIPHIVNNPLEMIGKINALIVDHRHPKYHLDAAKPFVKEGIPTFIEKPFCYRADEGKKFLQWANEIGTPVCSYSSVAHNEQSMDIKKQISNLDEINQVIRFGPADFKSEYGGFFYYGVHLLQPLMYWFGDQIKKVKVTKNKDGGLVNLVFENGLFATLILQSHAKGWRTFVESGSAILELKSEVPTNSAGKKYADIIHMFRTGELPRSHESMLRCVAALEVIEVSAQTGEWENVKCDF